MQLSSQIDSTLPPLAWCARLTRGSSTVKVICGKGVELSAHAFFEGAWAGDFAGMDFASSPAVFGSGGIIGNDDLTLVPPSHTCERIQVLRRCDEVFISNSLCFLLSASREQLDPRYRGYINAFQAIVYGLDHFAECIPTALGNWIELLYCKNLTIRPDLSFKFSDKPGEGTFKDYAGYVATLSETIKRTLANAADPARTSRYKPLNSISSGYDSLASSVLVRAHCGKRALTFAHARSEGGGDSADSGADIGRILGLDVREFSRDSYLAMTDFPEAEFLATGMSGEDVILRAFEPELAGSVFFTGFHGDKIWDRNTPPNDLLKRGDLSGASLNEFRCRVNFVHVPLPFIAARMHRQVHKISNSSEMQPWSIGGDYDRPIPRRIVEEAGIPREMFGQKKRAASALIHLNGRTLMTPRTRQQILDYRRRQQIGPVAAAGFRWDAMRQGAGRFSQRLIRKLNFNKLLPNSAKRIYGIHNHGLLGPLPMIWAIEKIAPRYASAARHTPGGEQE